MFSHSPGLNQFSFFLAFSVLIYTFLIRTILVPAIMALLGQINFWPRKLVAGHKSETGSEIALPLTLNEDNWLVQIG